MNGEGELQNKNTMLCTFDSRKATTGALARSSSSSEPERQREGQLLKEQEWVVNCGLSPPP